MDPGELNLSLQFSQCIITLWEKYLWSKSTWVKVFGQKKKMGSKISVKTSKSVDPLSKSNWYMFMNYFIHALAKPM